MSRPTVHIIGAGLAGLAAGVALTPTGVRILVHEAAKAAGGRCRSYVDARLGMEIDNGNHLMLSCNENALAYARMIGAEDRLTCFPDARLPFVDLASGRRSTLSPLPGPLPLWLFNGAGEPSLGDYGEVVKLMLSRGDRPLQDVMRCKGALYDALLRPFLLAALNTEPAQASSALVRGLLRATLLKGAKACKPIMVRGGLSGALVEPALLRLRRQGVEIAFAHRLHALHLEDGRIGALRFDHETMTLSPADLVILATPAPVACALAPWISAPTSFNAIVNAHFAVPPPPDLAPITAITNANSEWLFAYSDRLSVTISAADRLLGRDAQELAETIWREVATIGRLNTALPPWRIVKEKRATFAATPDENARRPPARTSLTNLLLAGDWTATGMPATIEGAIKSGFSAAVEARHIMNSQSPMAFRKREARAHADHG